MTSWFLASVLVFWTGCAGEAVELEGRKALEEFGLREEGGEVPSQGIYVQMASFAPERVWDGLVGLLFIAVLWGLGALIHSAVPGFRHYTLAALGIAVVLVFFLPRSFYEFKGLRVDEEGVTVETYISGTDRILFGSIDRVYVTKRPFYPIFTDARELVLEGRDGSRLKIPFFVQERDRVAKAIWAGLKGKGIFREPE